MAMRRGTRRVDVSLLENMWFFEYFIVPSDGSWIIFDMHRKSPARRRRFVPADRGWAAMRKNPTRGRSRGRGSSAG